MLAGQRGGGRRQRRLETGWMNTRAAEAMARRRDACAVGRGGDCTWRVLALGSFTGELGMDGWNTPGLLLGGWSTERDGAAVEKQATLEVSRLARGMGGAGPASSSYGHAVQGEAGRFLDSWGIFGGRCRGDVLKDEGLRAGENGSGGKLNPAVTFGLFVTGAYLPHVLLYSS